VNPQGGKKGKRGKKASNSPRVCDKGKKERGGGKKMIKIQSFAVTRYGNERERKEG